MDARKGNEVVIIEFSSDTAKEWINLGLLKGSRLSSANFYKYNKASCDMECSRFDVSPIIEKIKRSNKQEFASWLKSEERAQIVKEIDEVWVEPATAIVL